MTQGHALAGVPTSTSTTDASSASGHQSVHDGRFDADASSPEAFQAVSNGVLVLNPSSRFQAVGSMTVPDELIGRPCSGNATRRPVAEVPSTTVVASLGKGSTHWRVSSGSHPGGDADSWSSTAAIVAGSAGASGRWVGGGWVVGGGWLVVGGGAVLVGRTSVGAEVAGVAACGLQPLMITVAARVGALALRIRPIAG